MHLKYAEMLAIVVHENMKLGDNTPLSAPNPSICFLLVDFHTFQELIFEKKFSEVLNPFVFTSAKSY